MPPAPSVPLQAGPAPATDPRIVATRIEAGPPADIEDWRPDHRPVVRPVTSGATLTILTEEQPDLFAETERETTNPAPLQAWLQRFLGAVVEVMAGRRSIRQLDHVLTPAVQSALRRAARSGVRPQLISVRGQRTGVNTVEAAAHLRFGNRSVAVAFAMIRPDGRRWVCNAWQLRPEDLRQAAA